MKLEDASFSPKNVVCTGITLGKPLLQLQLGHATAAVAGKSNEDFHGIVTPHEEHEAQTRGIAVAIADGVSTPGRKQYAIVPAVVHLPENQAHGPSRAAQAYYPSRPGA